MRHRIAVRIFVLLLLALGASSAGAQAVKPVRVGLLDGGERMEWWDAFRDAMRELGYVDGRSVVYEARYAKGKLDTLPALAKQLVAANVSVIVTGGAAAAVEAKRVTRTIPIVMASGTDQVSLGLASTLSRPGGNVTGVSSINSDLMAKRFDLLRELVPRFSHLGVLWHADNSPSMSSVRDLEGAAAKAGIAFQSYGLRTGDDLGKSFAAMGQDHVDALVVVNSPYIYGLRAPIAELARKYKIASMYGAAEYVDAGGLVAYAPSYPEMFRSAAVYVDRIVKGADPATMPIEQPTKFELVLNARAANAIGLAVPQAMYARATRIDR